MIEPIRVSDLVVGYGTRTVAAPGSFQLASDRVTLVVGPNGSGKTTLLKTLAGLLPPLGGRIVPVLVPGPSGAVLVHSTPFLFTGHVGRNLRLAAPGADARARRALAALRAEDLWSDPVWRLSTGQRQRVGLARALAAGPRLLLADEPEGGLDGEALDCWQAVIRQAVIDRAPIIVVAAHRPLTLAGVPVQVLTLDGAADSHETRRANDAAGLG